jgi:hypothetical protein
MKLPLLGLSLCLTFQATAETNHLGTLSSSNQFVLDGKPPFIVFFESLEIQTNIYGLLNHKESFITKDDLPTFIPPGIVKLTVSEVAGSETNVFTFQLLSPPPRVRLSRRYPRIEPPAMPISYTPPPPLPDAGKTNLNRLNSQVPLQVKRRSE